MPQTKETNVLLPYSEVVSRLPSGRSHLLLGNGFSIGCDPLFRYDNLFERAVNAGLSPRAQAVFNRVGTNNFEAAMRLLTDAHWIGVTYGLIDGDTSELLEDLDIIKKSLVTAIAESHPAHTGVILDLKKQAAANFLQEYHNVFTTNYDLLIYWLNMFISDPPPYEDGFRSDPDDPHGRSLLFCHPTGSSKGIFFLHGGLHLFQRGGYIHKHSWIRTVTPLTTLIKDGLDSDLFPIFVAEGESDKKLEQIWRNGYLSYAYGKFSRIEKPLVIYGLSLNDNDTHILNAISDNLKLRNVYIGVHGSFESAGAKQIEAAANRVMARRNAIVASLPSRQQAGKDLTISYFDSQSAKVWGE